MPPTCLATEQVDRAPPVDSLDRSSGLCIRGTAHAVCGRVAPGTYFLPCQCPPLLPLLLGHCASSSSKRKRECMLHSRQSLLPFIIVHVFSAIVDYGRVPCDRCDTFPQRSSQLFCVFSLYYYFLLYTFIVSKVSHLSQVTIYQHERRDKSVPKVSQCDTFSVTKSPHSLRTGHLSECRPLVENPLFRECSPDRQIYHTLASEDVVVKLLVWGV